MQGNNYIHKRKERGRERMEPQKSQNHRTLKPGGTGDTAETTLPIVLADGD